MKNLLRILLMPALIAGVMVLAPAAAKADTVAFTTTGIFGAGTGAGTSTTSFSCGIGCTTTLSFAGTANTIVTPAGASFGDLLVTSTAPPGSIGAAITGSFTLNFFQTLPTGGTGALLGSLSGTLGFNSGIGTLTFSTTMVNIGGIVYTVNPSYTIALPVTGVGGGAGTGVTTVQGTVTGSAVPEPASMLLLGTGLIGVAGAARRRFKVSK